MRRRAVPKASLAVCRTEGILMKVAGPLPTRSHHSPQGEGIL